GGPRGQGRPDGAAAGTGTAPAVVNVAGNFSVTIDIPGQQLSGILALVQQGSSITGSLSTQLGVSQVKDGRVTAEGFTFSSSVEFGGSVIDINVKGTVTGNQVSGTIDSPQGTIPFTGTRNP
ncbi:MAG: hypothetical protein ABI539_06865, partial [Acidobacteriota bacterium]